MRLSDLRDLVERAELAEDPERLARVAELLTDLPELPTDELSGEGATRPWVGLERVEAQLTTMRELANRAKAALAELVPADSGE